MVRAVATKKNIRLQIAYDPTLEFILVDAVACEANTGKPAEQRNQVHTG